MNEIKDLQDESVTFMNKLIKEINEEFVRRYQKLEEISVSIKSDLGALKF